MTERRRLPLGMTPIGLNRDAAAAFLGVSTDAFDANVRPHVPPVAIGNRLVWDVRSLARWLAEQQEHADAFRSTDDWLAELGEHDRADSRR